MTFSPLLSGVLLRKPKINNNNNNNNDDDDDDEIYTKNLLAE
jgi:hypothetical protein